MDFNSNLGVSNYDFRLVFGRTKIEFDPKKDADNRRKHKYLLESAVYLLEGLLFPVGEKKPYLVSDSFIENGEVRHMHLSVDDSGTVVLMVTTMRSDEAVRVISFRRASEHECSIFQKMTGYVSP